MSEQANDWASREAQVLIKAAARELVEAAFGLIQLDPHQWSTRPCQTCRTVTQLTGIKFGCEEFKRGR